MAATAGWRHGRTFRRYHLPDPTYRTPAARLPPSVASENMGPSKEKKPARITTACNACRSRKQKCSGQKPTCRQCLDYKRPCNWPEQLRRGPEKGYAEALENRLQLTESLLLNLLPHVSDEQLSLAIPRQEANQDGYVPFPRLEKRGVESWSQFPLDTFHGVRRWQHACFDGDVALRAPVPKKRRGPESPPNHSDPVTPPQEQEALGIGESFTTTRYLRTPDVSTSAFEHTTEESPPTRISTWDAAPPLEFQRQFLW